MHFQSHFLLEPPSLATAKPVTTISITGVYSPRIWGQCLQSVVVPTAKPRDGRHELEHRMFPLNTRSASVLCRWWSPGTGCPKAVGSPPWTPSEAAWMWPLGPLLWVCLPEQMDTDSLQASAVLWPWDWNLSPFWDRRCDYCWKKSWSDEEVVLPIDRWENSVLCVLLIIL